MTGRWRALRRLHRDRRGVSAVQFALVSLPLFILLFGVWDFGLGIWQYSAVSEGTRQAARFAIVRGNGATGVTPVGPTQEGPTACDGASPAVPVTQVACAYGFPVQSSRLTVTVTWPSGFNRLGEAVVVEGTYQFQPALSNLFNVGTINLKSRSRMIIACCS